MNVCFRAGTKLKVGFRVGTKTCICFIAVTLHKRFVL